MASKIYSIDVKNDFVIDITFFNGSVKRYDFNENDIKIYDEFPREEEEFRKVSVDKSKTHLVWENGMKMGNDQLWHSSVLLEVTDIANATIKFAERMRVMREALWLTQKDLEERTGIYQADISKIERGEANPSLETMERIARGMGYDLQFFAAPAVQRSGHTVEDIFNMEGDEYVELIDGEIYDRAVPSISHQEIISFIHVEIANYIRQNKGKCKVLESPTGLMFENDDRNYFLPDLLVICDSSKIKKQGIVGGPDFVLEVVSKSTARNDYYKKLAKYAENGVREYWIIDPIKKNLVKYYFENSVGPEIHFFNEEVPISIYGDELIIDLKEIDAIVSNEY